MFHNDEACGTLLEIRQIQATYSPKRSTKPKTFLLLPKVPRFTKFGNNLTRTTFKKEAVNTKSHSYNSQASPRGQKPLKMNPRREENIVSYKKIYLSEMQSKAIGGVPSAPPGTPSSDQLKKIEYVPSLMDIKSQRAIKLKLEKIVHKLRKEEQHTKENSIKQDQKKLKESLIELKQRQRLEIYALNRVMTELENENFKKFMDKKEAVSLGV
ncbi:uncharacterized protein LOC116303858 [Actinia tenebrosa]|uniref:Small vasohibin-binding protein n=1 Tax=Actinia tenebrosa TaxID=6105 RepID=A0A6P8IQW1_ACTTE|nr:uncharacterized protein LOC116303858 [Actinia tenebrosa]